MTGIISSGSAVVVLLSCVPTEPRDDDSCALSVFINEVPALGEK